MRAFRIPELGYYLILTDTRETEENYFTGFRDSLPREAQKHLVIKVIPKVETKNLVSRCVEELDKDPHYRIPWIVFGRDQVSDFDSIIEEAKQKEIHTGWSNPCFEIWLHAYLETPPFSETSVQSCEKFGHAFKRITKQEYDKADKSIYVKLKMYGNEIKAIQRSKQKCKSSNQSLQKLSPTSQYSVTTVYALVEEILKKVESL